MSDSCHEQGIQRTEAPGEGSGEEGRGEGCGGSSDEDRGEEGRVGSSEEGSG